MLKTKINLGTTTRFSTTLCYLLIQFTRFSFNLNVIVNTADGFSSLSKISHGPNVGSIPIENAGNIGYHPE